MTAAVRVPGEPTRRARLPGRRKWLRGAVGVGTCFQLGALLFLLVWLLMKVLWLDPQWDHTDDPNVSRLDLIYWSMIGVALLAGLCWLAGSVAGIVSLVRRRPRPALASILLAIGVVGACFSVGLAILTLVAGAAATSD